MQMGKHDKPTDLIKDAFEEKTWHEIHTTDSWRVFKILSELVEGFEKLARIGPCVSIFGSARTHHNDKYYRLAEDIAFKLTRKGYGIITGGGPGIMKAATDGAESVDGNTVAVYWEPKLASFFEGKNLANVTEESDFASNNLIRNLVLI